ncbi:hypothetical protein Acr_09g0006580 [Actinidia rufa]|uniref:Uncharacterized protein n=1 Tax=Actinidia rufa TaxID=165716 RepID=A0A7J0F674_9ERIC|nr:hypothetical protein Acr_09g0006580 [Actinidia rufa]
MEARRCVFDSGAGGVDSGNGGFDSGDGGFDSSDGGFDLTGTLPSLLERVSDLTKLGRVSVTLLRQKRRFAVLGGSATPCAIPATKARWSMCPH